MSCLTGPRCYINTDINTDINVSGGRGLHVVSEGGRGDLS